MIKLELSGYVKIQREIQKEKEKNMFSSGAPFLWSKPRWAEYIVKYVAEKLMKIAHSNQYAVFFGMYRIVL